MPLINIEEHNKKVEMIEGLKPKTPKVLGIGFKIEFDTCNTGEIRWIGLYQGRSQISSHSEVAELQNIAACIIKAFGPIPQELIDNVEVEQ